MTSAWKNTTQKTVSPQKKEQLTHEQTLIWALRKELATKTKQLADLKMLLEKQTDELTSLKVENSTLLREASQTELKNRLHAIYEEKLADAVEEER